MHESGTIWFILPDFDHLTKGGARCTVCGGVKQPHHIGVFRPPTIDEIDGFSDICEDCMHQAANVLGYSEPNRRAELEMRIEELESLVQVTEGKYEGARSAQMSLARENVVLQDIIEDLEARP